MKVEHMKIGEDIYTVKIVHKLQGGEACCNIESKLIEIERCVADSPITNFLVSLLHESFHGVADHFGIQNKATDNIIEAFARGTVMLMIDNTEFFEEALTEIKKEKEKWQKGKQKPKQKKSRKKA